MRKIDTRNFKRATRSTPREINRQIALNLLREHQPISRADLARRMEVGRGVVTSLVNELIAEGVVEEGPTIDAPRGRRPQMLYVRTRDRLVVAVDVRLSQTSLMLADFGGTPIGQDTFRTPLEPAELIEELGRRIDRLRETQAAGACEGLGIVVPGMVDPRTGRVLNAPQLGWRDVEVREALEARTGLPVQIENAALACALAQMWLGERGEGSGDFVYVTVSDGVGAGVVVNGELVRGHDSTAGEFGHVPIDPDGPRCLCGARGCWEAYTANRATLARYLGQPLGAPTPQALLQSSVLGIADVIARAKSGDARAGAALAETGRYLGLGLATIVNALNPARIIVGGEITAAWDRIEGPIRAEVDTRALTPAAAATPILPEQAGVSPRLRGATALVTAPAFAAPRVA
ncbi:MAG TPA: ROK family transcriptional regulator [Longimicrobiales bacterium]|nr:ROK family transcriptional regulator [Longimicrobiales bacterium]